MPADRTCVPCRGGVPPLKGKDIAELHHQLAEPEQRAVVNEHHLERTCTFPDFKSAPAFVNKVGTIAEQQGQHPYILLGGGKVEITTWTHQVSPNSSR